MEIEELCEQARKLGYRLVHNDRVRTMTVSQCVDKRNLSRIGDHKRFLTDTLCRAMSSELVRTEAMKVSELSHEWAYEFRGDLTILAHRPPPVDSPDHFIYRPRDWEKLI